MNRAIYTGVVLLAVGCGSDSSTEPVTPSRLAAVQGQSQQAAVGTQLPEPLVVRVMGSNSQPMAGVAVAWSVGSGGGAISAATSTTGEDGTASTSWTLGTTPGQYTVSASVQDLAPAEFTATATAGAPTQVTIEEGDGQRQIAGTELDQPLTVLVADEFGNPVSGASVEWSVSNGAGMVSSATSSTNSDGMASTRWTLGADPGEQTVRAQVGNAEPLVFTAEALRRPLAVAGGFHTCAMSAEGRLYCWGGNGRGQVATSASSQCEVGDDQVDCVPTPSAVPGGARNAIVVGGWHSCSLDGGGAAYCWGLNRDGELGNRSTDNSPTPQPVAGGLLFASMDAGRLSTCGVALDGTAYCWGDNWAGQLGNAGFETGQGGSPDGQSTQPVPVDGGLSFRRVSVGGWHACGVTTAGDAYCWGYQGDGALGGGEAEAVAQVTPRVVVGGLSFRAVSAGRYHTCGVTQDSRAYCWGYNLYGQLGDGTFEWASTPRPVAGGHRFLQVRAGGWHTCGITEGGEAYCWGVSASGRLGTTAATMTCDSVFTCASAPQRVEIDREFSTIDAAYGHSCGVTADHELYCWGRGEQGQIGDGSLTAATTPVLIDLGLWETSADQAWDLYTTLKAGTRFPLLLEGRPTGLDDVPQRAHPTSPDLRSVPDRRK